ncbi:MAG: AAA family ATPase [Candidatus Helarchaeota archaeon]
MSLLMFAGIQGSGKSTISKLLYERLKSIINKDYLILISSDDVRLELTGCYKHVDEVLVWKTIRKRVEDALKENKMVIFDATNIRRSYRAPFLKIAIALNTPIYLIFLTLPLMEAIKRNENRTERQVPNEAIKNFYDNMEFPSYSEGYEKIIYLNALKSPEEIINEIFESFKQKKLKME